MKFTSSLLLLSLTLFISIVLGNNNNFGCKNCGKKFHQDKSTIYYQKALQLLNTLRTRTNLADPSTITYCPDTLSTYLSDHVQLEIGGTGVFSGPTLASEYFCILTVPVPGNPVLVQNSTSISLSSYVHGDTMFLHMELVLELFGLPGYPNYVASFYGIVRFDHDDNIIYLNVYHKDILGLVNWISIGGQMLQQQAGVDQATAFCGQLFEVCQGYSQAVGWTSMPECITDVSQMTPLDTPLFQTNTAYCRGAHLSMAYIDPVTHCSHAGKSGGGECV